MANQKGTLERKYPLPRLNPLIRLFRGPTKVDGSPSWTLYHPAANKYFQIGWMEFECLRRMIDSVDAKDLVERVNRETTLDIDLEDVKEFLTFLMQNGLLEYRPEAALAAQEKPQQSLWKRVVHNYLFFSLPLVKPEPFLKRAYPFVKPLMSRIFVTFSLLLLFVMAIMTIQRGEEFLTTFISFLSLQGAVTLVFTLMALKVLHELGHAFTAHKYGVDVPHMGVAFMVLYPVLYTETSAAWKLQDKRSRMHIGLAGIMTELVIAAYALVLWHILPPGTGQSLAFAVVALSLIGSLLVNLNPLMRFDGYFVTSDMIGIENLHAQGFAYARVWIRRVLFGLEEPYPAGYKPKIERFLIAFGLATIIYRFFLFLGIALLVYWLFFKPLGLFLMIIELAWFIGRPAMGELKIWWQKRAEIAAKGRARLTFTVLALAFMLIVLPVHSTVNAPAVLSAENVRTFYPPETATIKDILVSEKQAVKAGDVLAVLSSSTLEYQIRKAEHNLTALQNRRRILSASQDPTVQNIEAEIEAARIRLADLKTKQQDLIIIAPFDGTIRSVMPDIHAGMTVSRGDALFDLVDKNTLSLVAYVNENDLPRLQPSQNAKFRAAYAFLADRNFAITAITQTNIDTLDFPALSSVYAGPIPSERDLSGDGRAEKLKPRQSLYKISFSPSEGVGKEDLEAFSMTQGTVYIQAEAASPMLDFLRQSLAFIMREAGLN